LGDDADPRVDRLLQLDQALLGVDLVVVADDLELLAEHAALGVDLLGEILERLQARLAGARRKAGERIDEGDPDGFLRARRMAQERCDAREQRNLQMPGFHGLPPDWSMPRDLCGRAR